MPFVFLRYLQPTHYFRLFSKAGVSVFPKVTKLPDIIIIINQLQEDAGYVSEHARDYDMSWQAVQKGYIGTAETYAEFKPLPVVDEYRFIRKNFHAAWVFYVLLLRLFSFHHPIRELQAWIRTRGVARAAIGSPSIAYPDCALPLDSVINWKKHVVWVEYKDRKNVAQKVFEFHNALTEKEFIDLQHTNRKLWEEKLALGKFFKSLQNVIQ